jgi:antitoxin PrlF
MDISAKLTSKGQLTVPKAVRDALGLHTGDRVIFRVDGEQAALARTPDLLDLAGVVAVPEGRRGTDWDDVRAVTRQARGGA